MTDSDKVLNILQKIADAIHENEQFLTDLDAAIGDNDHGINMNKGFQKVATDIPSLSGKDIGSILKRVGMDLVSTVGGSAGPLYGTAFMKAGAVVADKNEREVVPVLRSTDHRVQTSYFFEAIPSYTSFILSHSLLSR